MPELLFPDQFAQMITQPKLFLWYHSIPLSLILLASLSKWVEIEIIGLFKFLGLKLKLVDSDSFWAFRSMAAILRKAQNQLISTLNPRIWTGWVFLFHLMASQRCLRPRVLDAQGRILKFPKIYSGLDPCYKTRSISRPFNSADGRNRKSSFHLVSVGKEVVKKFVRPRSSSSLSCLFYLGLGRSGPAPSLSLPIKFIMNTGVEGWQELNGSKSGRQSKLGWRWSTGYPLLHRVFGYENLCIRTSRSVGVDIRKWGGSHA